MQFTAIPCVVPSFLGKDFKYILVKLLISNTTWKEFGGGEIVIANIPKISLPNEWNEVEISIFAYSTNYDESYAYITHMTKYTLSTERNQRICVGGYEYSSTDFGSCWITLYTDNTFAIRHLIYAGTTHSVAYYKIRYR